MNVRKIGRHSINMDALEGLTKAEAIKLLSHIPENVVLNAYKDVKTKPKRKPKESE